MKLWLTKQELLAEYRKINPRATMHAAMAAARRHQVLRMHKNPTQATPQQYSAADWQRVLAYIRPKHGTRHADQAPPPQGWHRLPAISRAADLSPHRVVQWAERGCFEVHFYQGVRYADPSAVVFALSWRRRSFCRKRKWSEGKIARRIEQQAERGLTPPPGVPYPPDQCIFAPELITINRNKRQA